MKSRSYRKLSWRDRTTGLRVGQDIPTRVCYATTQRSQRVPSSLFDIVSEISLIRYYCCQGTFPEQAQARCHGEVHHTRILPPGSASVSLISPYCFSDTTVA